MSDYYLDSSALVKRYVDEPGSNWVRQIIVRQALIVENLPVPTFITSDADLLLAAEAEHLVTDNPLHHTSAVFDDIGS